MSDWPPANCTEPLVFVSVPPYSVTMGEMVK